MSEIEVQTTRKLRVFPTRVGHTMPRSMPNLVGMKINSWKTFRCGAWWLKAIRKLSKKSQKAYELRSFLLHVWVSRRSGRSHFLWVWRSTARQPSSVAHWRWWETKRQKHAKTKQKETKWMRDKEEENKRERGGKEQKLPPPLVRYRVWGCWDRIFEREAGFKFSQIELLCIALMPCL